MEVSNIYAIILAGGSGSRLWPLSREVHPKQLMKIDYNYTLFQAAFMRLINCVDDKNILSVTNVKLESQVKTQLKEMQEKFCRKSSYRIITEPECKNTAPAIALSIKYIEKLQKDRNSKEDPIIVVVPSDNLILDNEKYCKTITEGIKLAQDNYIVTFGVKPDKADIGLGYIKAKNNRKIRAVAQNGMKVEEFVEKPDIETACEFVDSDRYYYNSGIFIFKASVMMGEIKKYQPEIYSIIKNAGYLNRLCNNGKQQKTCNDSSGKRLERCRLMGSRI